MRQSDNKIRKVTGPLLEDIRALDLTDEKGLFCGKILANLGVKVIKVEMPGGDRMRKLGLSVTGRSILKGASIHKLSFVQISTKHKIWFELC